MELEDTTVLLPAELVGAGSDDEDEDEEGPIKAEGEALEADDD